jgi:hypothetical protein
MYRKFEFEEIISLYATRIYTPLYMCNLILFYDGLYDGFFLALFGIKSSRWCWSSDCAMRSMVFFMKELSE